MKKNLLGGAVCILACIASFYFFRAHPDKSWTTGATNQQISSVDATNQPSSGASNAVATSPGSGGNAQSEPPGSGAPQANNLAARAGKVVPETNDDTNLPPDIVLRNVRHAVHQYGEMFGGNPVGTNPEITAALTGKNPKQINFLNGQPGMTINDSGELVDAWGTPYFFHQLSGTEMEIHSAGPDKVMWTSDDLIAR